MSDLSNRIAELSPEKRALLLQRLKPKKDNAASTEITRQSRESNAFPLSFAQQRLWFFDQLEPGNPIYNICSVGRLKGNLNAIALEQTFNEIIKRHEVLRTTFTTADGQPVQVIAPSLKLSSPAIDLRSLSETKREQEVQRLAEEESQRPFDLKLGPLLRVSLLHISESEYVLIFAMHHIISDGWSMQIMIQ